MIAFFIQFIVTVTLTIGGSSTPPLRDPILSFLQTFSPKIAHTGGPHPPNGSTPLLREILDPPLLTMLLISLRSVLNGCNCGLKSYVIPRGGILRDTKFYEFMHNFLRVLHCKKSFIEQQGPRKLCSALQWCQGTQYESYHLMFRHVRLPT